MKNITFKYNLATLILICIAIFATCKWTKQTEVSSETPNQDTLFLHQWKMEKKIKKELIAGYEKKLNALERSKDSLQQLVQGSKKAMAVYRVKAKIFQDRLTETLTQADTNKIEPEILIPIIDSLAMAQLLSDNACDTTIVRLENIIAERDSSIGLHQHIQGELRDLGKEQELQNIYLTEKLNTAYKVQGKIIRQNKLLAGGLLILSGITTSLLISQNLK